VAGYPVTVLADPGLTRIAVLLLACNAEEAMPSGSAVTISVVPDGLTVADSGGGFAQPVYSTLFHPFTSTKPPERGVGLGLHVARAAMRLQQGDLQLTSSGESGTVLTLVFSTPLEDADPVRDSVGSEVAVASA